MGTTKVEEFEVAEVRASEIAKAIGHPARIAILNYIISKDECICGEIVDELPLAQATISQHLKELKRVGLIKGRISGVKSCYCINEKGWKEAEAVFSNLFASYRPINECCEPDGECC